MHDNLLPLSNASLKDINKEIRVPRYDRDKITPGIVHIGVGNFHRAHQCWYLHRLMQEDLALDWGIIGAGVRLADEHQRLKLKKQDYLTTLIELDPTECSAEVVGSLIGFVPVEENNSALIEQMTDAEIRIVSLTVTEGGYYIDPVSKKFDPTHPEIQYDISNPNTPKTAFGALVAALKNRRVKGLSPFTCLSCDNLQGNGDILRETVVTLASFSDTDLANWIDTNCTFPNSMVDCIVPSTGERELALAHDVGIADEVPVSHENFRQWVIEDKFCSGRPNWERVGAQFTNDVYLYEKMKLRILNAGHQLIANAGELLSIELISGCMRHKLIGDYFAKVANEEIAPHVKNLPDMNVQNYVKLVTERFSNVNILDTVRRVAFDGSSRHTGFVLPIIRDAIDAETPVSGLLLSQAIWARMCAGWRENGTEIIENDPFWEQLNLKAIEAKDAPLIWLEQDHIYGDLVLNSAVRNEFTVWSESIWSEGIERTLFKYLKGQTL